MLINHPLSIKPHRARLATMILLCFFAAIPVLLLPGRATCADEPPLEVQHGNNEGAGAAGESSDTLSPAGELSGGSPDTLPGIDDLAQADSSIPDDPAILAADESASLTEPVPRTYSRTDLRKGERLFKGLMPFQSGMHDCASCHYTKRTDTLNWNPSAHDLAVLWREQDDYSIREKLDNLLGMRMMNDHLGMRITPEEERQLEAYLSRVLDIGPGELRVVPVNAFIFWGLGLLMALALIDLLITKKIRFKALHMLVIIVGLVVHMQYAVAESRALGRTQGYAPDQPIKFSHLIHSGENEIDCQYCHTIAHFSLSAGIPSNNTCLNCHNVIREGTQSGRFEINKIHRAEATAEPVRWIRVHKLPDHSFFSHAQHVNAGKIECQDCHGPVEEMHIIRQVEDLSMGWCLRCHRDNAVDFLTNPYYQIYEKLHEDMRAGRIDQVTAARVGGEDCMKCHY